MGAASCVVYEVGTKSGHSQRGRSGNETQLGGRPGNETQLGGRSGNETPPLHVWVSSLRERKRRPRQVDSREKSNNKKVILLSRTIA